MLTSIVPYVTETPHPRILMTDYEAAEIAEAVKTSDKMKTIEDVIYNMADNAVKVKPTWYEKTGKRLLGQSRRSLRNLFSLSYAYRQTKDEKYLKAAEAELESVCSFADWNPSHFLDVAELCLGVSIGYDWLYYDLPDSLKSKVEQAIEHNAFDAALGKNSWCWFYKKDNNWNQVCNTGLVYGAFAIGDKVPEKADKIFEKCFETIHLPVDQYGPDGAYPEGPMYWGYGTQFNTLLNYQLSMAGLEPYVGDGGFDKTADFFLHSIGPTGYYFNYSDGGKVGEPCIGSYYFAALKDDPALMWNVLHQPVERDRVLPAALIFAHKLSLYTPTKPTELTWIGRGTTPVYFARTAWDDPNALFFGVKGGYGRVSHAHLDQGSFVFDALGERWAVDIGSENYYNIEKEGVDLWSMEQDSDRWQLLSYNNMHHNTLTFDGQLQDIEGRAEITHEYAKKNRKGVSLNLTPCYDNVDSVLRTICLVKGKKLEIHDYVAVEKAVTMDWNMVTDMDTECEIMGDGKVLMHRNGKMVTVTMRAAKSVKFETHVEDCLPETSYEKAKCRRIRFSAHIPDNSEVNFSVTLSPMMK